ncbi:hypothetical protein ACHAP8_004684 [Fusarium lateritium]
METFNRFPDLPTEIRVQIWKLVIREDRAGVHIFSHCDQTTKYTPKSRIMMTRESCGWIFSELSPLHYFDSVKKDVPRKNVSTYLIDGGMWTACKESRFIMESHFRQSQWIDILSVPEEERKTRQRAMSEETRFNLPSTGKFFGAPLHNFTVLPHRDLFVLQVDCVNDVNWDGIGLDQSLGWGLLGCDGINHLGIEFNPDWWDSDKGEWDHGVLYTLKNAAFEADNLVNIWIIDHGLKRRKNAPPFEEKSNDARYLKAFYASDRRFLAVDPMHPGPWTDLSTGLPPDEYSWDDNKCSLNFVKHLEDDIEDELQVEDHLKTTHCWPSSIGVLGWDDL